MANLSKAKKPVELAAIPFVQLGYVITKFLVKTPITPNQVTLVAFIFGIFSALFIGIAPYYSIFGLSSYWLGLIGAIFGLIFLELDAIDGQLARAKRKCSKLGAWLDGILGFAAIQIVMVAVIVNIWTWTALVLGLFALSAYPTHFMFVYMYKSEFSDIKKKAKKSLLHTKNIWLKYLYGEAIFWPIVFVGYLINIPILILWFYAVLANLYWIALLFVQYKSFRHSR